MKGVQKNACTLNFCFAHIYLLSMHRLVKIFHIIWGILLKFRCTEAGISANKLTIGLKKCPLPPDQCVISEKSDNLLQRIGKCIFVSHFWTLKIAYQTRKWLSKRNYQTWIWFLKSPTERESGLKIFLLDMIFPTSKSMIILIMYGVRGGGGGESRIDYVICAHSLKASLIHFVHHHANCVYCYLWMFTLKYI